MYLQIHDPLHSYLGKVIVTSFQFPAFLKSPALKGRYGKGEGFLLKLATWEEIGLCEIQEYLRGC